MSSGPSPQSGRTDSGSPPSSPLSRSHRRSGHGDTMKRSTIRSPGVAKPDTVTEPSLQHPWLSQIPLSPRQVKRNSRAIDVGVDVGLVSPALPPHEAAPQRSQTEVSSKVGGWFAQMMAASTTSKAKEDDRLSPPVHDPLSISDRADAQSVKSSFSLSPSKRAGFRNSARQASNEPQNANGLAPAPTRWYDRARQYILDPDANVDKCQDDIWLLGVRHEGWRPEPKRNASPHSNGRTSTSIEIVQAPDADFVQGSSKSPYPSPSTSSKGRLLNRIRRKQKSPMQTKDSLNGTAGVSFDADRLPPARDIALARSAGRPPSRTSSVADTESSSMSRHSSSISAPDDSSLSSAEGDRSRISESSGGGQTSNYIDSPSVVEAAGWPTSFYWDFYSRIQLTYRSGFDPLHRSATPTTPIPSSAVTSAFASMMSGLSASISRAGHQAILGSSTQRSYTSDSGWGCMLRTGQSLLANALLHAHLGRSWRRSMRDDSRSDSRSTRDVTYKRLVSLFLDDQDVEMHPFSVYQFAKEGERLGKPAGEWFGPSTAAGAIKALVAGFAPAAIGVTVAYDTTIYQEEVFEAALSSIGPYTSWERPVLILVPSRLGIDRVNPVYYPAIKHYFSLSQCIGIAGGRPSSSYYFVGSQADSLFYLDPHHTAPTVPSAKASPDIRQDAKCTPMSVCTDASGGRLNRFYAEEYTMTSLSSFHCKKVRKMPLSNLDPSMLLGLFCKTRADWDALCAEFETVKKVCKLLQPLDVI